MGFTVSTKNALGKTSGRNIHTTHSYGTIGDKILWVGDRILWSTPWWGKIMKWVETSERPMIKIFQIFEWGVTSPKQLKCRNSRGGALGHKTHPRPALLPLHSCLSRTSIPSVYTDGWLSMPLVYHRGNSAVLGLYRRSQGILNPGVMYSMYSVRIYLVMHWWPTVVWPNRAQLCIDIYV